MQRHSWREHTEQGIRFYRASHQSTNWTLQSQLKEEEWQLHDPISGEEWGKLREVLWRKYQRGRGPWKLIERIDRQLEDLAEGGPDSTEEGGGDKGRQ